MNLLIFWRGILSGGTPYGIKFWDGLEAHPTRKKIFVGWASSPS
ncbi:hypothetical protein [Microcoleus sp. PH2017_18_LLB_O_A]|nr:hypothetical protein [Microcoleus sp. PH2017_18_LLB_O_A]